MEQRRVGTVFEQLLVAMAAMLFAAGCAAQPAKLQSCGSGCVEVLLRYYQQPQKSAVPPYESSKIELRDSKTREVIGNACQVCDPKVDGSCKNPCNELPGATLQDASQIILLQTRENPTCYYICSGGWCRWFCF